MTRHIIQFELPGKLTGWARAARKHIAGNQVRSFTPQKMAVMEATVRQYAALAMRGHKMLQGPVRVRIWLFRVAPKSWSKKRKAATYWVMGKPDSDNTCKLLNDSMNKIVFDDDAQIAELHITRRYSDREYCVVRVDPLEEE